MRDRSTLGAAGLVVAALALASLAAQPRPESTAATATARQARAAARPVPAATQAAAVVALRDGGRLDLNLATTADLELLPGIGPMLARRIVEDRARAGAYRSADDLTRVSGIGPAKLERIRALVCVGARADDIKPSAQRSNRNTPETSAVR